MTEWFAGSAADEAGIRVGPIPSQALTFKMLPSASGWEGGLRSGCEPFGAA